MGEGAGSSSGESGVFSPMQQRTLPKLSMPSLSLSISKVVQARQTMSERFGKDGVGYVHGVHSSAMPDIAKEGLQPVATRIGVFAPINPVATVEQRKTVAAGFRDTMKTGERGNTLDAWVKDPEAPIATGVSLFQAQNAQDAHGYANMGGNGFPVILGVSSEVALQRKSVGHELSEGPIAVTKIPKVYVPKGRSAEMNERLVSTDLRGRSASFPELFEEGTSDK